MRSVLCGVAFLMAVAGHWSSPEASAAEPAQQSSTPAESSSDDRGGPKVSVSGIVVDPAGKPVAGADVILRDQSADAPWGAEQPDVLATTRSDSNGAFRLSASAPRSFAVDEASLTRRTPCDVVVRVPGFAFAWKNLPAAENPQPLEFVLEPESVLRGRVVDEQGSPISGVMAKVGQIVPLPLERDALGRYPDPFVLAESRLAPSARTDADGGFAIAGLPRGRLISVTFEHDDYELEMRFAMIGALYRHDVGAPYLIDPRVVPKSPRVYGSDLRIDLSRGKRINGRVVRDDTGAPAAGARILLDAPSRHFRAVADGNGRFSFRSLSDGKWQLTVDPLAGTDCLGRRVAVDVTGAMSTDIDVRLPVGKAVVGRVVDAQTERGVAGVRALFEPPAAIDMGPDGSPIPHAGISDEDGRFRLVVPPGKGRVRIHGPVPHYDLPPPSGRRVSDGARRRAPGGDARFEQAVDVADQPVPELRFPVARGLVIHGLVSDETGRPVVGAEASIVGFRLQNVPPRSVLTTTRSDASGEFSFDGLPVFGDQLVRVVDEKRNLRGVAYVQNAPNAEGVRDVEVDVTLRPTGSLTGTALAGGKPLPGALVALGFAARLSNPESGIATGVHIANARTDEAGRFRFDRVISGTSLELNILSGNTVSESRRGAVVNAGETFDIAPLHLTLTDKSVSGIVVDVKGKPVANATISVTVSVDRSTWTLMPRSPRVVTDEEGKFVFDGVPDLPITVFALPAAAGATGRTQRVRATTEARGGDENVKIVIPSD